MTDTSDDEMTPHERETIDERIEELEDADRRYSTREVAEELNVDLDYDGRLWADRCEK